MELDPPRTLPRGIGICRPDTLSSGSVSKHQLTSGLFKVLVKHNPGFEYVTKAGIVDNFDLGDAFYSQLIFSNILSVENVLEALGDKESFEIELQYTEEENLADPYLFFDITTNKWDISDFKKHLLDAQTKCRFQYFDHNEI